MQRAEMVQQSFRSHGGCAPGCGHTAADFPSRIRGRSFRSPPLSHINNVVNDFRKRRRRHESARWPVVTAQEVTIVDRSNDHWYAVTPGPVSCPCTRFSKRPCLNDPASEHFHVVRLPGKLDSLFFGLKLGVGGPRLSPLLQSFLAVRLGSV